MWFHIDDMTSLTILSFASKSAPFSNRYSTTGKWQFFAAIINRVQPPWYIHWCVPYVRFYINEVTLLTPCFASTSAPFSTKYSTIGKWPCIAAYIKGVYPNWYIHTRVYTCVTFVSGHWLHRNHRYLTRSSSFTSCPWSSSRDRTAVKSPSLAASITYPCMNTFAMIRVGAAYRSRHDDFDELCLGERWSDQFQTTCKQINQTNHQISYQCPMPHWICKWKFHHTCWKWRIHPTTGRSCNQVNNNASTSHPRQSKHATQVADHRYHLPYTRPLRLGKPWSRTTVGNPISGFRSENIRGAHFGHVTYGSGKKSR